MKVMNILFLIFLILGSFISISLSSKLRKYDDRYENEFLEETSEKSFEDANEDADMKKKVEKSEDNKMKSNHRLIITL